MHGKCSYPKFYDTESVQSFWCSRACKNYKTPVQPTKKESIYSGITALRRFADEHGLQVLVGLRNTGKTPEIAMPFLMAYWVETGTLRLKIQGTLYDIHEKQLIAVARNTVHSTIDDQGCTYAVARSKPDQPDIMQLVFDATAKLHAKEVRALKDSLRDFDETKALVARLHRDLDKAMDHIARVADLKAALHKAVDLLPDTPAHAPVGTQPTSSHDGEPARTY